MEWLAAQLLYLQLIFALIRAQSAETKWHPHLAIVRGPQLMFHLFKMSKLFLISQLSKIKSWRRAAQNFCGVYLAVLPVAGPSARQIISSSSLINSSAGPAVFRQR